MPSTQNAQPIVRTTTLYRTIVLPASFYPPGLLGKEEGRIRAGLKPGVPCAEFYGKLSGAATSTAYQRPDARRGLRADRARLFDGLRCAATAQLRTRRRVYGRGIHRLRDHSGADPGAGAADRAIPDHRGHAGCGHDRLRRAWDCHRAVCLPSTAQCTAHRTADQRVGRFLFSAERRSAYTDGTVPLVSD